MSRSLPVWLLAPALAAFVGCGGGDASDSGAVASNSDESASSDPGTSMPPESSGMQSPGGDGMGSSGDMGSSDEDMYGSTGDPAEMMEGYGPGGGPDGAETSGDPDEMMELYGPGGPGNSDDPANQDTAEMEAAYAAGGEGYPGSGGPEGASAEEMELYGAAGGAPGAEGEIPGGEGAYAGGEYPNGPGGGAVEEKVPEGLDGKAQLAFRRGKEKDAMQFLYAHALTTDAGAQSLLPTIRWVGALREPKLAVRWGAGFVVTAPRNFNGDPKPVGSQQKIPTRGANRGDGAGGNDGFDSGGGGEYGPGDGSGGGGGGGNDSLLKKGAGELGEKLAAAYTERCMRGDFGNVLKQAMEASSGGNRGNAGGGASEYGGEMYGADGAGAGTGYGAKAGPEGGGAAAAALTKVTQIMPGLSMLGIGTQKELFERARADGIDVVVIIDVKLRVNTSVGLVTNDSTLSLRDTKSSEIYHTTKKFNNIAIQKLRADGKEDGVDKELAALFEIIDAKFKMADLPAVVNAKVAANRVANLAKEGHDNPLPVLAEARMYHQKGLLEESELFAAYEEILGVDSGRLLATGTEEDKEKVLSRWLPEI